MPWYSDLRFTEESAAFVGWLFRQDQVNLRNDRRSSRVVNFSMCVSTTLGDRVTNAIPPLQSKLLHGRLADILLSFNQAAGATYWMIRGDAPARLNLISDGLIAQDPGGGREAAKFERVGQAFVGLINATTLAYVKKALADLRDGYDGDIQLMYFAYLDALRTETASASLAVVRTLDDLRQHQRVKIEGKRVFLGVTQGGHASGKFYLRSRVADGKPMLLVSSKPTKSIKKEYMDMVDANPPSASFTSLGTYATHNGVITFTVKSGLKDTSTFQQAIDALKCTKITRVVVA